MFGSSRRPERMLSDRVGREALQQFFETLDTDLDGYVTAADLVRFCQTRQQCNTTEATARDMFADAKRRRWQNGQSAQHLSLRDIACAFDSVRAPYREEWLQLMGAVVPSGLILEGRGVRPPTAALPMDAKQQFEATAATRTRWHLARRRAQQRAAGRPRTSSGVVCAGTGTISGTRGGGKHTAAQYPANAPPQA